MVLCHRHGDATLQLLHLPELEKLKRRTGKKGGKGGTKAPTPAAAAKASKDKGKENLVDPGFRILRSGLFSGT